jgi:hypothetical protein
VRGRRVRRPTLLLDSLGLASIAVGVGMWLVPLGVVVGGLAAIALSWRIDQAAADERRLS